MPLQFDVFDADSGAFAYPDAHTDVVLRHFDELLDDHQSGRLGDKPYLAALERLIAAAPELIDAYAHSASHWHRMGKPKKALDAALAGLGVANRHIPEGFSGLIEWGHIDNRPYLRAMHIALLSYMRLRRHKDAVNMIELMLARNPNDNQGVRYLLGSELLRCGDFARARTVLAKAAADYPPSYYELALCHMLCNQWLAAATALRRGFAANPYIAEILGGNPDPAPLAIWHASHCSDAQTARDYVRECGALWHQEPASFAFTRWLFNHSLVLAERAAVLACQEAMLWETDAAGRQRLGRQERELAAGINDTLSATIVTQRQDRRGKLVWPWLGA